MLKRSKIILVHDFNSSPDNGWYHSVLKELEKDKIEYAAPIFKGGLYPDINNWIETIYTEVIKSNKNILLIGHGLGTRAILLFLEKYLMRIKNIILVSAFKNNIIESVKPEDYGHYGRFFTHKIDLEKLKTLVDKFVVIHAKNDPVIPYEQGVELSRELNAQLVSTEGYGHINKPNDKKLLIKEIKKYI